MKTGQSTYDDDDGSFLSFLPFWRFADDEVPCLVRIERRKATRLMPMMLTRALVQKGCSTVMFLMTHALNGTSGPYFAGWRQVSRLMMTMMAASFLSYLSGPSQMMKSLDRAEKGHPADANDAHSCRGAERVFDRVMLMTHDLSGTSAPYVAGWRKVSRLIVTKKAGILSVLPPADLIEKPNDADRRFSFW